MNGEKVIKGLEICKERKYCCPECPYYDRDAEMGCHSNELMADALAMLKEQPHIVRCKDCRYGEKMGANTEVYCNYRPGFHSGDWFCADGERKENDGENA